MKAACTTGRGRVQAHTEERFENRSWSVFQSVAGVAPPPPLVATRNLPTHSFTCSDVSGMLARSLASPMENALLLAQYAGTENPFPRTGGAS
jgi:hypothetical protein